MIKTTTAIALSLLVASQAFAAADTTEKPKGKQQAKMSMCNKDAKQKALKGAERKQFMSECLKAKA